jgi:hypothetical protein
MSAFLFSYELLKHNNGHQNADEHKNRFGIKNDIFREFFGLKHSQSYNAGC